MLVYFSSLHRWASLLVPPVGFLLNTVLLYLVCRQTPAEIRVNSRILVQTCLFDCLFLAIMLIGGMPVPVSNWSGASFYFFRGYFVKQFEARVGAKGLQYHVYLFYAFHYFGIFGVCIQFVYCYLCLNFNVSIKLLHYLCALSLAISVNLILQIMFSSLASPMACYAPYHCMDKIRTDVNTTTLLQMIANRTAEVLSPLGVEKTAFGQLSLLSFSIILTACYAIIWFCASRMLRIVNAHTGLNHSLKALHRNLITNLSILALFHFLLTCLNVMATLIANYITNVPLPYINYVLYTLMSAVPVLNPIATILTSRPYRDVVAAALFFCCKKNNTNTVQPLNTGMVA